MSRFCGECGAEHTPTQKFCQSCGKPLAAKSSVRESAPSSGSAPKNTFKTDPGLVCPKCGKNEFYTGKKHGELEDICSTCDVPMRLTKSGKKETRNAVLVPLGIFAVLAAILWTWIGGLFEDGDEPEAAVAESAEIAEPEPEPEPEETYRYADNPEACDAMLDANDLFLDSWEGIQNQSIPQDQLVANLEEGASILDAAYPAVPEGDMYWWMVSQSNNLAIAASSFVSGDTSVTSEALAAYGNDITDYEQYCS